VKALDDVLAAHGVGVRPLYRVIDLLRTGDHDLGELVRLSTAPRRSVEAVLAALGDDLDRSGDRLRIAPGVAASYLQYNAPRFADPLDEAVATHELLPKVAEWVAEVPSPLAALDHVQATPETVLRRALWLDAQYDLASARLLFLGDHDLTSLAVRAVCPSASLTVADLDERVLAYLDDRGGHEIRTVHADLRVGLPPSLGGAFDLVFSDPPYTPEGMGLFAARGVQALREPSEGRLLLAYGYSPRHPALGAQVQRSLATLGLTFEAILPGFNRYFGAQAIGSAADLYVCQPTAKAKKMRSGKAIYTHGSRSRAGSRSSRARWTGRSPGRRATRSRWTSRPTRAPGCCGRCWARTPGGWRCWCRTRTRTWRTSVPRRPWRRWSAASTPCGTCGARRTTGTRWWSRTRSSTRTRS
jgi:hypothetical protein